MATLEQDFYADPEVYDILHAPGTGEEVEGLIAIARRFDAWPARRMARWLEPACGSGRYAIEAARRGVRTVGVDLSEEMVAYARSRARALRTHRRCRFVVGDMREMRGVEIQGGYDLALCPINSIRHIASDAGMVAHLSRVRSLLAPGGVYVVGLSVSKAEWEFPSEDVWEARRGGTHVRQVVQYEPPTAARGRAAREERVFSVLHVNRGARGRTIESRYVLRTYSRSQWARCVGRAGLEIAGVVNEVGEDVELREVGYHLFVLRARGSGFGG